MNKTDLIIHKTISRENGFVGSEKEATLHIRMTHTLRFKHFLLGEIVEMESKAFKLPFFISRTSGKKKRCPEDEQQCFPSIRNCSPFVKCIDNKQQTNRN